jgi:hypothetical protein
MQADVQKRRPVCFYRHFFLCFSRFRTLGFSPDRDRSWPSPDDLPTVWPDPDPKLSTFSESLGKRGYTEVAIGSGVGNEHPNAVFFCAIKGTEVPSQTPRGVRQIGPTQPTIP